MYEKIRSRKSVPALYEEHLIVRLPSLLVVLSLSPLFSRTVLSLLPKLKLCAILLVPALTPRFPRQTPTSRMHQCYKAIGRALSGPQMRRRSVIPRRALRVMCLRQSGTRASLFHPDLCVYFLPKTRTRSTDDGMRNAGDPSKVTTPRQEPAASNR